MNETPEVIEAELSTLRSDPDYGADSSRGREVSQRIYDLTQRDTRMANPTESEQVGGSVSPASSVASIQTTNPAPAGDIDAQIAALKRDPDYGRDSTRGRDITRRIFDLTQRDTRMANPDADGHGMPDERASNVADDGVMVEAPVGPWEYNLRPLSGEKATDGEITDILRIGQALHTAEVPVFAVRVAQSIMQDNVRNGLPNAATIDAMIASGKAELSRKYGADAPALIADAKAVFDRLNAVDPAIGTMLANTGAINNPLMIETLANLQRNYYAKRK